MSTKKWFLNTSVFAAGAVLAMFAFGPCALANPVRINFSGTAGSGYADLTLEPDPDASANYQPTYSASDAANGIHPPLSKYDPAGAQHIKTASGTFSDAGLGFSNVAITGVVATSPGVAPPGETLPKSFSWLIPGTPPGTPGQYSYDNLFYVDGSPLVCPPIPPKPYTFHGGFLDIFGVMFTLHNGDVVALWSDGVTPGGLTYGMNVFTQVDGVYTLSDSQSQFAGVMAAVPAPDFLWLFGAGVLGLFAWRRSVEKKKV